MISLGLLSCLATTALALPTPLQPRQEDCSFVPNQANQSSAAYTLRIESLNTNTTVGYLDAFSTSHAIVAPSNEFASSGFNAPTWNTNTRLIFYDGDQTYERGFNLDQDALAEPESIAAVVSTPGCGTPLASLVDKYADRDECGLAGRKVSVQTGCPAFGTGNTGNQVCTPQRFFVCDNTGLQGISDAQQAVYYGVAETAQYGPNCQEVDLVSECA